MNQRQVGQNILGLSHLSPEDSTKPTFCGQHGWKLYYFYTHDYNIICGI